MSITMIIKEEMYVNYIHKNNMLTNESDDNSVRYRLDRTVKRSR